MNLTRDGFTVFPVEQSVLSWASAAYQIGRSIVQNAPERRHGGTWFVGVDALPNAADGSISGVQLAGQWMNHIQRPDVWHNAQISVIFPGYPQRDAGETVAAHRYRRDRDAAHVDGLLPEGTDRRRHLREPHGFIAGIPLNDVAASPLVVWSGSHVIMQAAFASVLDGVPPNRFGDVDVTDTYQAARREVFERCRRVELTVSPGQAILLHRHLLHGVAPWGDASDSDGRMITYFRPLVAPHLWL